MAKIKMKKCKNCGCKVVAEEISNINHPLHIVLSLLSAGLWLVVYLVLLTGKKKYLCKQCGRIIK